MTQRKYLLVIGPLRLSILRAVASILKDKLVPEFELVILARETDSSNKLLENHKPNFKVHLKLCSFEDKAELASLIEPIKDQFIGVSCRSDKHIQDLRRVVPLLPSDVYVSSERSLTIATNKRLMRQAFVKYAPSITPQHIKASSNISQSIEKSESSLGYPVIVKPANLASSLLIQACDNRQELEAALNKVYKLIYGIYEQEERYDEPEVIIEEYLEGDFYSIDTYSLSEGQVYFCPPVSYIPAKQLGIDDFFLYKRSMPTKLSESEIEEANNVTRLAIEAVGLNYSSAHVELVLTKNGWRIIELGPRLGRFRDRMYRLSYGIDHSLNDIKIHLGIRPEINTKLIEYCAAYSIYPSHEGRLIDIKGLNDFKSSGNLKWHRVYSEPDEQVTFAKYGGHSLAELIVSDKDEASFNKLTKRIEEQIYADID